MIFTSEAIIVTNKKDIKYNQFSKEDAEDVLYYSEIENFTCSLRTTRDVRYQITTKNGGKCTLILLTPLDFSVEDLVCKKTIFYKNLIEKSMGVTTGSESAIFAALYAKHISGLPIAEGIQVKITANKERILFIHNSQEMSLPAEQIIDIAIKTDTEIQSSYVSSIGNALLGARLFGTAGAIIGGQAREKRTTIETFFLIVTYKKQSEEQKNLKAEVKDLQQQIHEQEQQTENIEQFVQRVKRNSTLTELTPYALRELVKAVYVEAPDKSSGKRRQKVHIEYNLVGYIPVDELLKAEQA